MGKNVNLWAGQLSMSILEEKQLKDKNKEWCPKPPWDYLKL
jgi:hypothetical protein